MDSLASQLTRMQQMQDWILQQKEQEMQTLRKKVEQQQQELMQKEIEIALLKDRLSKQDERLQQELKYLRLQYQTNQGNPSSGSAPSRGHPKHSSSRPNEKKIHIQELHVNVGSVENGRNATSPVPPMSATATTTTTSTRSPTPPKPAVVVQEKEPVTRVSPEPTPKAPPVARTAPAPQQQQQQQPPQQQQQQQTKPATMREEFRMPPQARYQSSGDVVAELNVHDESEASAAGGEIYTRSVSEASRGIADLRNSQATMVFHPDSDDKSDVKIPKDVDAQEATDKATDRNVQDQDDGYEMVKQPEPVVKEERKEYTFTPPGANPKEEPVPASVADEEDDEAEGEDEFNPDPVWEAPGSEIKPKAAPEPAPFKQGPLTQAVAASRAPAVDLNHSRGSPMGGSDSLVKPPNRSTESAPPPPMEDLTDMHGMSIPMNLVAGANIVDDDEDVTMATFEVNSVFRGHSNDGEDGRSMGGTVASSTYGEDRQKVVEQTLLDPYGDKGRYTGVVLRSTGMPHGLGRMLYEDDGRTYEGDWRHGRWHGHGHATFANGDSYEGEYRFDQRHGRGIYSWNDGRVYDGVFAEDKRHGTGTFKWPDGATYVGDFVQGQREGKGRYTFSDGGYYNGEWVDGRYEGYGEGHWEDGRTYKGEWQSGMAHGKGSETYPDGRVRHSGQWMNDEPIRD